QNDLPEGVPAIAVRSSVETASMVGIKQTWRACIHKLQLVLQLADLMELDEKEMIGVRLTAPRIADRPGSGLHRTVSHHGAGTRLPARLGGGSGIGAAAQASGKTSSCTVMRNGSVQTTTRTISDSGSSQAYTDHLLFIQFHKVSELEYKLQFMDTGPPGLLDPHHGGCLNGTPDSDGWHTFREIVLPPQSDPNRMEKMMQANLSLSNINGSGCSLGSG